MLIYQRVDLYFHGYSNVAMEISHKARLRPEPLRQVWPGRGGSCVPRFLAFFSDLSMEIFFFFFFMGILWDFNGTVMGLIYLLMGN